MTARRRLLIASGLVALSASLPAQPQERRVRRIGFFFSGNAKYSATSLAAFCEGMVEGRDYLVDSPRVAEGRRAGWGTHG